MLVLGSTDDKLCLCDWEVEPHRTRVDQRLRKILQAEIRWEASAVTERAAEELREYFAGRRSQFDIPLAARGHTVPAVDVA